MAYHVPVVHTGAEIAYTNTVPRGHMRSPGAPQAAFAIESALDELAELAGLSPAEIRRRNLVRPGAPSVTGREWAEYRGGQVLDAAMAHAGPGPAEAPPGWLRGTGLALYAREAPGPSATSVRLIPLPDGRVRAEVADPGDRDRQSHRGAEPARRRARRHQSDVQVAHVGTGELARDPGVGGSRVTVGMAEALDRAAPRGAAGRARTTR